MIPISRVFTDAATYTTYFNVADQHRQVQVLLVLPKGNFENISALAHLIPCTLHCSFAKALAVFCFVWF